MVKNLEMNEHYVANFVLYFVWENKVKNKDPYITKRMLLSAKPNLYYFCLILCWNTEIKKNTGTSHVSCWKQSHWL